MINANEIFNVCGGLNQVSCIYSFIILFCRYRYDSGIKKNREFKPFFLKIGLIVNPFTKQHHSKVLLYSFPMNGHTNQRVKLNSNSGYVIPTQNNASEFLPS